MAPAEKVSDGSNMANKTLVTMSPYLATNDKTGAAGDKSAKELDMGSGKQGAFVSENTGTAESPIGSKTEDTPVSSKLFVEF